MRHIGETVRAEERRLTAPCLVRAITFATGAHRGQTDKTGQPFLGHPLRVMAYTLEALDKRDPANPGDALLFLRTDLVLTAAVLHDTVEDAGVSIDDLRIHFGDVIAYAVDALSRREGEPYRDYIDRCAENDLARLVKIADIRDNSDPRRQWAGAPLERYTKALEVLERVREFPR